MHLVGRGHRHRLVPRLNQLSENALFDSLTALSLLIAFYYALTGLACAIYYRRHLLESLHNLLLIGVGPVVGAVLLPGCWSSRSRHVRPGELLYRAAWLGLGPPLVIGIAFARRRVLMLVWRGGTAFWQERAGVADPDLVHGREERGVPMSVVLGYDESPGAERALTSRSTWPPVSASRSSSSTARAARRRRRGVPRRTRKPSRSWAAATAHAVERPTPPVWRAEVELVHEKPAAGPARRRASGTMPA